MNVDHNERSAGFNDSPNLNTIVTCFVSAYSSFARPHRDALPGTSLKTAEKKRLPRFKSPYLQSSKIMSKKLPNFLIVGAAKCGTSSLHKYLEQHPEIFMSKVKEPRFISSQVNSFPLN